MRDDPVPGKDVLELLSGKGTVGVVLGRAVPEESAVILLVRASEELEDISVAVVEDSVPGGIAVSLFVGVVELPRG